VRESVKVEEGVVVLLTAGSIKKLYLDVSFDNTHRSTPRARSKIN
jgi:hypothetical protein